MPADDGGNDEDLLAGIGPRLRALRQRTDTTLTALAAATGFSLSTLSRLESGKRKPTGDPATAGPRLSAAARRAHRRPHCR
jgi:DNA-binding XRE family transcriptional regulator